MVKDKPIDQIDIMGSKRNFTEADSGLNNNYLPGLFGSTPFENDEVERLHNALQKKIPPEFIATRPGPFGKSINYIEGNKVVALANDVLGFSGWSSSIVDVTVDFIDMDDNNKVTIGISSIVRVTLKNGAYHEDIGYGIAERINGKGAAFEKAKKEAVTDATKRALRNIGNVLGGCLYDKEFLNSLSKYKREQMKTQGNMMDPNKNNLTSHDFYNSAQNSANNYVINNNMSSTSNSNTENENKIYKTVTNNKYNSNNISKDVENFNANKNQSSINKSDIKCKIESNENQNKLQDKFNGINAKKIKTDDTHMIAEPSITFSQCEIEDDLLSAVEMFEQKQVNNGNVNSINNKVDVSLKNHSSIVPTESLNSEKKQIENIHKKQELCVPNNNMENNNLIARQLRAKQLQAEEKERYKEFYKNHSTKN